MTVALNTELSSFNENLKISQNMIFWFVLQIVVWRQSGLKLYLVESLSVAFQLAAY